MTDQRLAKVYQQAVAARAAGDRSRCVAPEALRALARREGSEDVRLATLDHVMACRDCERELALVRAVEEAGADLGVPEAAPADGWRAEEPVRLAPRVPARRVRHVALALAASVLVVVAVSVVSRAVRGPGDDSDVLRGEARAVVLERPPPGETVALPVTFAWRAVPGASRYTVEVLAADGSVAWSVETAEPTATLSDGGALAPGAEYRWWVRVTGGPAHQSGSEPRAVRVRAR